MGAPAGRAPVARAAAGTAHRPRPARALIVSSLVLVVVAGLAAWAAHGLRGPGVPAAPVVRAVDLGAVALSVPGSWAPARPGAAGLPGLGAHAAAFAPIPGLSGYTVMVIAPFDDPTLLPVAARELAGPGRPRRTAVAGLPAWSYRPRGLPGGRTAQVTVAPTTAGSLTVVCIANDAAWPGVQGCAADLTSAGLRGATSLGPSPTLAFRRELTPVLARLGSRRANLRAAPARRAEARFAARLAVAHVHALEALKESAPAAGAPRRVLRELRRSARWYRRLGVAASSGWPVRHRRARGAVRRSSRALDAAIAAVR